MYASVCLFAFAVFNFVSCCLINFTKHIYTATGNVRASANFSGTVAKEFQLSARESANFAVALISVSSRLRGRNFAQPYLGYPLSLASFRSFRQDFFLPECRSVPCTLTQGIQRYLISVKGQITTDNKRFSFSFSQLPPPHLLQTENINVKPEGDFCVSRKEINQFAKLAPEIFILLVSQT